MNIHQYVEENFYDVSEACDFLQGFKFQVRQNDNNQFNEDLTPIIDDNDLVLFETNIECDMLDEGVNIKIPKPQQITVDKNCVIYLIFTDGHSKFLHRKFPRVIFAEKDTNIYIN